MSRLNWERRAGTEQERNRRKRGERAEKRDQQPGTEVKDKNQETQERVKRAKRTIEHMVWLKWQVFRGREAEGKGSYKPMTCGGLGQETGRKRRAYGSHKH